MAFSSKRRVVVTGLGVISSLGIGWQEFWKNLIAGKSGISKITSFDTSQYDRHFGGEVKNFHPAKFMNRHKADTLGRTSQMAIAAAKLALRDAHFPIKNSNKHNIAFCIGTTGGERKLIETINGDVAKNRRVTLRQANQKLVATVTENLAFSVGQELGLTGFFSVFSTACSSGNYAIGQGFDLIKRGRYDYAIVGGADSFSQMVPTGFGRLQAIAPKKCQPFDKNRRGMIPGEGAGFLFLETLESAKKRNAKHYAEILGYGMACDAFHITEPHVEGVSKAIRKALENSKISPREVDYFNAHGTGTKENDLTESLAVNSVFGKYAKNLPVTSIKSMLGHTMGAAAALEAVSCCLSLKDGIIPPTINLKKIDPECQIKCVRGKSLKRKIKVALNNSHAFGGNNACLILQSKS